MIHALTNYKHLAILVALLAAISLAGCGGDDDDAPSESPAGGSSSGTPTVSGEVPTAYPSVDTPPAAACVTGEAVYTDPANRFSFCYPDTMQVSTTEFNGQTAANVTLPDEANRVAGTFVWEVVRQRDAANPCVPTLLLVKNERVEEISISGGTTPACFQELYRQDMTDVLLYTSIQVEAPAAFGFVSIGVAAFGPDIALTEAAARRLLDSAAFGE